MQPVEEVPPARGGCLQASAQTRKRAGICRAVPPERAWAGRLAKRHPKAPQAAERSGNDIATGCFRLIALGSARRGQGVAGVVCGAIRAGSTETEREKMPAGPGDRSGPGCRHPTPDTWGFASAEQAITPVFCVDSPDPPLYAVVFPRDGGPGQGRRNLRLGTRSGGRGRWRAVAERMVSHPSVSPQRRTTATSTRAGAGQPHQRRTQSKIRRNDLVRAPEGHRPAWPMGSLTKDGRRAAHGNHAPWTASW